MSHIRNAVLVTDTVCVCCPLCGEPQPSPDTGSDYWLPADVAAKQGVATCVSCDGDFRIQSHNRAQFDTLTGGTLPPVDDDAKAEGK